MKYLFSRSGKDLIGLVALFTGVFVGLSLFSYQPSDPSFNSTGGGSRIQNYCGYLGSFTADLLYQLVGLGAWAFALGGIYVGIQLIKRSETKYVNGLWTICLTVVLSCLASLHWPQTLFFEKQIRVGGMMGAFFTNYLKSFLNPIGTFVFLWALLVMLTVYLTQRPVLDLLKWPQFVGRRCLQNLKGFHFILKNLKQISHGLFYKLVSKKILTPINSSSKIRGAKFPLRIVKQGEAPFFPLPVRDNPQKIRSDFLRLLKNKQESSGRLRKIQHRVDLWELPQLSLLQDPPLLKNGVDKREIQEKSHILINKLEQFSVRGYISTIRSGPAVTMFQFKPNIDVKISRITDLADDLSLALSSESVRIIAPIPGKDVVGIETSNKIRQTVYLKDTLTSEEFWSSDIKLPVALGCQADGKSKVVDLRAIPHLLIAGSTGSGKSVFTVSMLSGLLFRHSPQTLRVILIDPKQVDLAAFDDIPHLLMPPLCEVKKSIKALQWVVREMNKRYRSMSQFASRDLESFNEKTKTLTSKQLEEHKEYNQECIASSTYYFQPQPYIVIFIEEFGDLMAVDKNCVEQSVVRLTQMARACGIHLVLAMQSPRKDVVTGLIKTNVPGRISFKVASKMDSRIILDESGAERLLSRGDMLFSSPGFSRPLRCHGPWLNDSEILKLVDHWRCQGTPEFDEVVLKSLDGEEFFDRNVESHESEFDEKYDEILTQISKLKEVSVSLLQRKFRLGYPRAARMIETFEKEGVIGAAQGSKPRQVLIRKI